MRMCRLHRIRALEGLPRARVDSLHRLAFRLIPTQFHRPDCDLTKFFAVEPTQLFENLSDTHMRNLNTKGALINSAIFGAIVGALFLAAATIARAEDAPSFRNQVQPILA